MTLNRRLETGKNRSHNAYPPPPIPAMALAAINDLIEGAKPQNIVPEPEKKVEL